MWALAKRPEPVTRELIPARGDRPAVTVTFNPQPSPLSLRRARRAVAEILRAGGPDATDRAGDAFSAEIIRHNLLSWAGLGEESDPEQAVEPTHDIEIRDEEGNVTGVELGTISAFLSEPRLFEAADREYVLPWTRLDAEKNGFAPSPSGTSAGATPADDTASSPATPDSTDAAPSAPTSSTSRERKKAKPPGK